jgi:serine/threonine protein kinase
MLCVVHDIHKLGVVWGDLKPENFIGSDRKQGTSGELLGIDFGSCAAKVR